MGTTGVIKFNPLRTIALEMSAFHEDMLVKEFAERGAAVYQTGDFGGAAGHFAQMLQKRGAIQGCCFAIAICCARSGNFDEALHWLDEELKINVSNPRTHQLKKDILAWQKKVAGSDVAGCKLTIFTVPKPFKGHIDIIQRNAIKSWLKLKPCPEILLMGNEEGMAEVAREFNLIHVPEIALNEHGTPLVSSIFEQAQERAGNDLVAYVNTDIIFTKSITGAMQSLENQDRFLAVGRRWDLDVWESLDFNAAGWDEQLMVQAKKTALLHGSTGIDYFIFRKGLYQGLPSLAVGRTAWDNWLIWEARRNGANLIDATHAIAAFHQEHPYIHAQGGVNEVWRGAEARRNAELACGHAMTIADADFCIDNERIVPMHDRYRCSEPTRQDYVNIKFRQSVAAFVRGFHEHALDLLAYIELDTRGCVLPNGYQTHKAKVLQALGQMADALKTIRESQPINSEEKKLEKTPICFMQVHTFYQDYLERFYRNNPKFVNLAFSEQIDALVRDGFSANHMMAPYLGQFGYESHLIIANNPRAQSQWLDEHGMTLMDQNDWFYEIVRKQINTIKPDILYLSDPISFDSRFVRSLTWKPSLVLGWRAANIPSNTDWSEFDIMLSCLSGLRNVATKLGAKATNHFFPGFPVWMNMLAADVEPEYDVVFTGSWTTVQHEVRGRLLTSVAEDAKGKYSCAFYLSGQVDSLPPEVARNNLRERFGVDMYKALQSGKIVLDARASHVFYDPITNINIDMGRNETANMRIFEATGSGCFLLTEYYDNLCDFFEIGKEIETFKDAEELKDKIHYYLSHPDERKAIARRGKARCLRDYSMEKRAAEFDRIIRTHLSKKSSAQAAHDCSVEELKKQAVSLIDSDNIQPAFDVLARAKGLKQPLEGLDLLRSRCFLKMDQPEAAIEALREEIRWFPTNREAGEMLDHLQKQILPNPKFKSGDNDFDRVLELIRPYTMLSEQRLYSLYRMARQVCENNLQGNFVECGVAAGGSSALLAWVIRKFSRHPRRLFSFDSFSGMPSPTEFDSSGGVAAETTGWGTGTCSAPEASVREICMKLGVEDVLTTVKGYFEETLPKMRDWVGMVAMLHMDGDWYESTRSILNNLYDRLANGAFIQVDDYGHWDGCRKAIHEFMAARSLHFDLNKIDGTGVWFAKPDSFRINQEIPKKLADDFIQDDPVTQGVVSQMSANERFQLYYVIQTLLPIRQQPVRFIEIGSYSGASLILTCKAFQRLGTSYQGISVEPGGTSQFHEVIDILKQNVIHISLFSHEASRQLSTMFSADNLPVFIFVDGDHTYEGVRQDIIDYYELLAPGGIMLFHDYLPELEDINRAAICHHHGNAEPGIRRACREVLEDYHKLRHIELPLLYPEDPTQTQAHLPIIPGVFSTVRAYRKPLFCNVERQPLNIVLISTSTGGGAGIAAVRLNQALLENRIDSSVITLVKSSSDPAVKVIHDWGTSVESGTSSEANVAFESWRAIAINHPERPWGLEMFSNPDSAVNLANIDEVKRADIVHLHWIAGLADYDEMALALKGKKIVWTLHDMNPFTGGCHYTNSCDRYFQSCGACPQLGSRVEEDLSRMNWLKKYRSLQQLDITVVTPSRWLARCVAQSSILGNARVVTIPNGIPTHIFKPYDRDEVRESLQISLDAKVILFGAESIANTRKGFVYLLEALKRYREPSGQKVILVTFGSLDPSVVIDSPYPLLQLGRIKDESHLACIYSMADVTVIPSLEDNLPNVILESMSSGTPVLGFNIGGIPDMVDHLSTGYVARARDVDDLMNGIQWMFDNVSSNMRAKCRDKVIKCFSYSVCSQRMKILYTSLCSSTV